jgi:hypothetical protein
MHSSTNTLPYIAFLLLQCREVCIEVQDHFLKELRDLGEQTKVYHHSCYNTHEAEVKFIKSHEKVEVARNATQKKKALGKEAERNRQYKVQKHLVMKNRNDLLVDICKCNSFSMQYFNMDIMDIIEVCLPPLYSPLRFSSLCTCSTWTMTTTPRLVGWLRHTRMQRQSPVRLSWPVLAASWTRPRVSILKTISTTFSPRIPGLSLPPTPSSSSLMTETTYGHPASTSGHSVFLR